MVKINKDKRGYWTRYKGRKIYLPKKVKAGSKADIIKWLIKKLLKLQKGKKSTVKPAVKFGIDSNLLRLNKGENANRVTENRVGEISYANALRNQQALPPLVSFPEQPAPRKSPAETKPSEGLSEPAPLLLDHAPASPASKLYSFTGRQLARYVKIINDKEKKHQAELDALAEANRLHKMRKGRLMMNSSGKKWLPK